MPRKSRFIALVLGALLFVPALAAASGALDGKTFEGKIGKEGEQGDADTFIFKDGRFDSVACHEHGFGDASYTATPDGSSVRFESTTHNEKGAKIDWKGTVTGDNVEGSALMVDPKDGSKTPMWFKAAKK